MFRAIAKSFHIFGLAAVFGVLVANRVYSEADCEKWPLSEFFKTATGQDVQRCLDAGADPKRGYTLISSRPIEYALEYGNVEVVRVLAAALTAEGVDLNKPGYGGTTYLHTAAERGTAEMIEVLTEAGSNIEAQKSNGETPLHVAAQSFLNTEPESGSAEMIKALVDAGANIEAQKSNGETPLHVAVKSGNAWAVYALLEKKADATVRNNDDVTPLHLAIWASRNRGSAWIIKALVESGADLEARDTQGKTPLHWATRYGFPRAAEAVDALLEAGADATARDEFGRTPYFFAQTNSQLFGTDAFKKLRQAQKKTSNDPQNADDQLERLLERIERIERMLGLPSFE